MATLASRSKLLSGLPSGTLAQHLAAISLGAGAILTSRMTVSIEAPQIALVQRRPSRAVASPIVEAVASQQLKPNRIHVLTRTPRIDVETRPVSLYLTQKRIHTRVVHERPSSSVVHRRRSTAEI